MTNDQIILIIIFLLTLNLLVVGFYLVLVLKEVRQTVQRVNAVLGTMEEVSEALAKPLVGASGMVLGLMKGLQYLNKFKDHREEEDA